MREQLIFEHSRAGRSAEAQYPLDAPAAHHGGKAQALVLDAVLAGEEGRNGQYGVLVAQNGQRFFGVAIPVWYRLDADGQPDYDDPIVPAETDLPVDPASDVPAGYEESQRGVPGGFVGDPDVMDTWATSSLTPQIAGGW